MKPLSDQQEKFCREYVIDLCGKRAAISALYSEKTAEVQASQLLSRPKVRKRIDQLLSERASRLEIKADRVLEEIGRLAFSNMQDYTRIDDLGKPVLDLSAITRDQFAAVHEIREDTTGGTGDGERKVVVRTTLKLSDKTKNLELLMRHLGMLQEKIEIHHRVTLEKVLESRQKAGRPMLVEAKGA
jgi:phage terminase small subunit